MELYFLLGYLGSGKTSALNNILKITKGKTAVIVNDFGALDVDGELVQATNKISIVGGSIFCTCKTAEFTQALKKTLVSGFDTVIVESSGLANPFTLDNAARLGYELAGKEYTEPKSICLVDCESFEKLCPIIRMMGMQVACADLVLLNKTDLVTKEDVSRIETLIKQINKNASIIKTTNGSIRSLDIKSVQKVLPTNVLDVTASKCIVRLSGADYNQLCEMCKKLSEFCHRIKGVYNKKVFQFCNGIATLQGETKGEDNFLVLLKCGAGDLVKQARDVASGYSFAKVE